MKTLKLIATAAAVAACSGSAFADCTSGTQVTDAALGTLLRNNTVCGIPGPGYTGDDDDRWQEEHVAASPTATKGDLFDFKKGIGDPIDPRKQLGTWTILGTGSATTVTYDYGTPEFTYKVFDNGSGTHSFCTGGVEMVIAKVQSGTGAACSSFP